VKLINLDNLVLIGPGSEWFWSAISAIAVAVTLLAIYRQLRLQRDAAAIEQLNELTTEWSSERLARVKLAVLVALEAGTDPLALPNRASTHIAYFWQRVGYLAQRRHMDAQLVYEALGGQIQDWWFWLRPRVLAQREIDHDPGVWQGFEWLARDAAARDADRGLPSRDDGEMAAKELPSAIEHFQQAIELEEALRGVPVRFGAVPLPVTVVHEAA
jgi:hypothetical protein